MPLLTAAGQHLTKAVEAREARLREFAMRVRAANKRITGGLKVGCSLTVHHGQLP